MKKTRRQQNALIINFSLNLAIALLFIWFIIGYIYPQLASISEKKQEIGTTGIEIEQINRAWLSFEQFKSLLQDPSNTSPSRFTQKLLERVDSSFHADYLQNTSTGSYQQYAATKLDEISNNTSILERRDKSIASILPSYGQYDAQSNTGVSDFSFTSYVERIFTTFNIRYQGKIGIGELQAVALYDSDQNQQDDLDSSVYATTLSLDISGKKKDIVQLIHYFENVGSLNLTNNNLEFYNDNFLTQIWRKIVLSGEPGWENYNIYMHQLWDISYIRMKDYIDTNFEIRDTQIQQLKSFLKQTQWDEIYEMEIGLNFYFKGLPKYQMRDTISDFFNDYNTLQAKARTQLENISQISSPSNEQRDYLRQLQSIHTWLSSLSTEVKQLKKNAAKPDEIEAVYRRVEDLVAKMSTIEVLIDTYSNQQQ